MHNTNGEGYQQLPPDTEGKRESAHIVRVKRNLIVNNQVSIVKQYLQTGSMIAKFSVPFVISRAAVAANVLVNGIVTPHISPQAAAAGPLMISIAYAVIAPGRSILISSGILAGRKQGELNSIAKDQIQHISDKNKEIGDIVKQSILLGGAITIPSAVIFAGMGPFLRSIGIEEEIVVSTSRFLNYTSIGLLPMYWSTSDQQFCLAIGKKNLPLVFGTMFPVLSMAFGYPLALGMGTIPKMDTAGLGLGMSMAAWVSFIALRVHFNRDEFIPYDLYGFRNTKSFEAFTSLAKLGGPLGIQALSEWLNMFLLSNLIGRKGSTVSLAANGSFQIMTAVNLTITAIGQAAGIKISSIIGEMRNTALTQESDLQLLNQQSKIVGNTAIILATGVNTMISLVLAAQARSIVPVFIARDAPEFDLAVQQGQSMLYVNAVAMVLDTISNTSASALSGSKDVIYAPFMRFMFMSIIALTFGAIATEEYDQDVNALFISRLFGILLATLPILYRWQQKDHAKLILPDAQMDAHSKPKPALVEHSVFSLTSDAPTSEDDKARKCQTRGSLRKLFGL